MNILALDIGGTRSRFAHCTAGNVEDARLHAHFDIATRQADIGSFQDLLMSYEATRSKDFLALHEYDRVVVAVAGPVVGDRALPPNIDWSIDLSQCHGLPATYLINDFAAQAHALCSPPIDDTLICIRTQQRQRGVCAIIGAGTGLGHCLLIPDAQHYRLLPSEAGQAGFSFTDEEQQLASFMRQKLHCDLLTNDHVVSGSGLQLLHQYYTDKQLPAADILADKHANAETVQQFSRLYARACRNYCLTGLVSERLILSGGLAAKHPELVSGSDFIDEFNHSPTHRELLENIGLYLNRDEQLGLLGALLYCVGSQAISSTKKP